MYELDFLKVGDGERSGDAIALRFSNTASWSDQIVVVVDGGFSDDGKQLVEHIRTYYGTDRVNVVVSTHPDSDHINGLSVVLSEFEVGELLMHRGWMHSAAVASSFTGKRVTNEHVKESLRRSLEAARDLEDLAQQKGVPIVEPFAGLLRFDGALTVVGPTEAFYEALLPLLVEPKGVADLLKEALRASVGAVRRIIHETMFEESLDDGGETTPGNNTSTVLLLRIGGERLLLSGDAGMPALTSAADYMEAYGLSGPLSFMQVPHHGSRRNVGPSILNRLLGNYPQAPYMSAIVSASDNDPKHPSKQVMNAFHRRGALVVATEGRTICEHGDGAPPRPNWIPVAPEPLHPQIEVDV